MFKEKYMKFKKTVTDYDLIPDDINKIIIANSGGKDAGVLASFLLEYKREERSDLQLEMIKAPVPEWIYSPERYFNKFDDV